jgi:hypothetical protein
VQKTLAKIGIATEAARYLSICTKPIEIAAGIRALRPAGQIFFGDKTSIRQPRLQKTYPNVDVCGVISSVPPKKQRSCCRRATGMTGRRVAESERKGAGFGLEGLDLGEGAGMRLIRL